METSKPESMQTRIVKSISERREPFSLRMAPMIDIIFLLLIFFLVAAKWRPQESFLPFQLPTAQADMATIAKAEPLLVYIIATETGCKVSMGQTETIEIQDQSIEENLAALMEKMKNTMIEQKRYTSDPVEIICQPDVKWEYVSKIYNVFFGAGLTDITFTMTQ
ncbi:MAG: hypothetical protein FVQ80_03345 [Planctomycetes bacterium]|nr:hypothetical protein [Planctomycetota bacterium]